MSKKTNVLLASAVAAGVMMMAAQSASAHDKGKASAASAIEQRLKMMEEQMNAMKSELGRVRAESASSAKVSELEAKVAKQATSNKRGKNQVFFRGGYAEVKEARGGNGPLGAANGPELLLTNGDDNGWYGGAGLDFSLSENMFGLTDKAELLGEIMFEYKNFGSSRNTLTGAADLAALAAPGSLAYDSRTKNEITQFTLTASPKIKFLPGSKFRPWVIPAGLAMHVISPPSNGVTVLNPGLMMGLGADYNIWENIYAGADFRYHFTGDSLGYKSTRTGARGTDIDGYTTGAYVGIGF